MENLLSFVFDLGNDTIDATTAQAQINTMQCALAAAIENAERCDKEAQAAWSVVAKLQSQILGGA